MDYIILLTYSHIHALILTWSSYLENQAIIEDLKPLCHLE